MSGEHADVVRRSFERQIGLFTGPDSPFAHRPDGALAWIEPLTPDMIALDVACGAGHAAEMVAPRVRQVIGIDVTRGLLQLGAHRLRDAGLANVLLQEGDAEALPFVDTSFDVVFCRSSLHHFANARRAFGEMVRVCNPGGRVVLVDLVAPAPEVRNRFDELHRMIDPSHVRTFVERELAELVASQLTLAYGDTTPIRLPVDIAFTEQSDRDAVLAAFGAEVAGGPATGFEPEPNDGTYMVSFTTCTVHGTRE